MALLRRRGRQGQRTLKCWHQRTSGEPLYEQGRIRGFSRRLGDCSGSTVFAALPDRRLVLTPEIRAFLGFLPESVSSFPSTRKCALALGIVTAGRSEGEPPRLEMTRSRLTEEQRRLYDALDLERY